MGRSYVEGKEDPVGHIRTVGPKLAEALEKHEQAGLLIRQLWYIYLLDCTRLKVTPVKPRVEDVPQPPMVECPECLDRYPRPDFLCEECGRGCCRCYRNFRPYCSQCHGNKPKE